MKMQKASFPFNVATKACQIDVKLIIHVKNHQSYPSASIPFNMGLVFLKDGYLKLSIV